MAVFKPSTVVAPVIELCAVISRNSCFCLAIAVCCVVLPDSTARIKETSKEARTGALSVLRLFLAMSFALVRLTVTIPSASSQALKKSLYWLGRSEILTIKEPTGVS